MKYNCKPTSYFDNRPTKEYLENLIYTEVGLSMESNVLQITGPALSRHIKNAKKIARGRKCRIYCIEISKRIFNEMKIRLNKIPIHLKKRVKVGFGDVVRYEDVFNLTYPCRFEDLDFCQALSSTVYVIAHRLNIQAAHRRAKYRLCNKCLVFTASLRPDGSNLFLHNLNTILNVIDAKISVKATMASKKKKLKRGVLKWDLKLLQRGRLSKLKVYNYTDKSQMISCVIMYV